MKKLSIIIALFITLTTILISLNILLIDQELIYKKIISSVGLETNLEIKKDNLSFKFSPYPSLVINQIEANNDLEFRNIRAELSIKSLLTFKPEIVNIYIGEVLVTISSGKDNLLTNEKIISTFFDGNFFAENLKIKNLLFIGKDNRVIFNFSNFVSRKEDKKIYFSANRGEYSKINGSFLNEINKQKLDFLLTDDDDKLIFKGEYDNFILTHAKIEVSTVDFLNAFNEVILNNVRLLHKNFDNERLDIEFELEILNDKKHIKNLIINSNSINGTGELIIDNQKTGENLVKLAFSKIDLSTWLTKSRDIYEFGNILSNIDNLYNSKIDFSAERIELDKNNFLSDVKLLTTKTDEGKLSIEQFVGKIDENGKFSIEGNVIKNKFRSIFDGKLLIDHPDLNKLISFFYPEVTKTKNPIPYILESDIKLSAIDTLMQNILLKTPDTQIKGNISRKYIGDLPRVNANLRFSTINLQEENLPGIPDITKFFTNFIKDMHSNEYYQKFAPLRQTKSTNSYDIVADNIILPNSKTDQQTQIYNNVSFSLVFSEDKITFDNIILSNSFGEYLYGNFNILVSGIKPIFTIKINDAVLESDIMYPTSMLNLRNKLLNEYDLSKIILNIDCHINKLYHNHFALNNLIFKSENNDNLLNINLLSAELFGGQLVSYGSVLLDPYTINISYALKEAKIDEIKKLLPDGIINTDGKLSGNGIFTTRGENIREQLFYLYSKSKIFFTDITLNNFSLDDFVEQISSQTYNLDNYKSDFKKALLTGKTQVKELEGQILIEKGIINMPSLKFTTKYTLGTGNFDFNFYNFQTNSSINYSFLLSRQKFTNLKKDQEVRINITSSGDVFTPKKDFNIEELEKLIDSLKFAK